MERFKQKALAHNDVDKGIWELITDMPYVNKAVAIVLGIINILIPGLGTVIMSYFYEDSFSKSQIVVGLSQFFLSQIIIGWLWAQYWSFLLIVKSFKGPNQIDQKINPYQQMNNPPQSMVNNIDNLASSNNIKGSNVRGVAVSQGSKAVFSQYNN